MGVNFIHDIAYGCNLLNDKRFFEMVEVFVKDNIDELSKFKLIKLVDIFKYLQNYHNKELKMLLEKTLETR